MAQQAKTKGREALMEAIGKVIVGQATDELIPVLIVASARTLALEADGDAARLEALGEKFCRLLQDTAEDMLVKGKVH